MRPKRSYREACWLFGAIIALGGCIPHRPSWYKVAPPLPPDSTVIAVDSKGSRIVAGTFTNQLKVGSQSAQSSGGADGFVARLAVDGKTWLRTFGGERRQSVTAVLVDPAGNIVVAGIFDRAIVIEGQSLEVPNEVPLTHGIFVAKLDPDGHTLWRRLVARVAVASNASIAFTPSGRIAVGASIGGPAEIAPDGAGGRSRKLESSQNRSVLFSELELSSGAPSAAPGGPVPLSFNQPPCAHDLCVAGPPLSPNCHWCVDRIVNVDGDTFCQWGWWDSICVDEVHTWCGIQCP
jgi:hypothetical protein